MRTRNISTAIITGLLIMAGAASQAQVYVQVNINQPAALAADAGIGDSICINDTVTLGGAPTADFGTPPYTYQWLPNADLVDGTVANPVGTPQASTTFVVTVTDSNNCSITDSVFVYVDPCVGIGEVTVRNRLQVYPNPSQGSITVRASGTGKYTMMDISGRQVATGNLNKLTDVSHLPNGTYFVQHATKTVKLVLTR